MLFFGGGRGIVWASSRRSEVMVLRKYSIFTVCGSAFGVSTIAFRAGVPLLVEFQGADCEASGRENRRRCAGGED